MEPYKPFFFLFFGIVFFLKHVYKCNSSIRNSSKISIKICGKDCHLTCNPSKYHCPHAHKINEKYEKNRSYYEGVKQMQE